MRSYDHDLSAEDEPAPPIRPGALERGLADSAAGRVKYLGDFAQYADDGVATGQLQPHEDDTL